ncbi:hypothetical protein [Streptomyces niveus]|uniref:hypothetical protein n=1 Tax=Streptomyces niveus TaxID=193462 RepID=UPI003426D8CB
MESTMKPSTTVRLPDGTEFPWEGFGTGPLVYDGDFADHSERLLGLSLSEVVEQTSRRLLPYRAGGDAPALILHSASRTTRGFDGDVNDLAVRRIPYDCSTYLEARAVFLARPGDLAVGRTAPWKESVRVFGIDSVDLEDLEHYYLYQALLVAAGRHTEGATDVPLARIIDWVRAHPDAIVRMYTLDREMQIFLLWLLRRTGLESLRIDANNHVVSIDWNRKRHIHPFVEDAARATAGWAWPSPSCPDTPWPAPTRQPSGSWRKRCAPPHSCAAATGSPRRSSSPASPAAGPASSAPSTFRTSRSCVRPSQTLIGTATTTCWKPQWTTSPFQEPVHNAPWPPRGTSATARSPPG